MKKYILIIMFASLILPGCAVRDKMNIFTPSYKVNRMETYLQIMKFTAEFVSLGKDRIELKKDFTIGSADKLGWYSTGIRQVESQGTGVLKFRYLDVSGNPVTVFNNLTGIKTVEVTMTFSGSGDSLELSMSIDSPFVYESVHSLTGFAKGTNPEGKVLNAVFSGINVNTSGTIAGKMTYTDTDGTYSGEIIINADNSADGEIYLGTEKKASIHIGADTKSYYTDIDDGEIHLLI